MRHINKRQFFSQDNSKGTGNTFDGSDFYGAKKKDSEDREDKNKQRYTFVDSYTKRYIGVIEGSPVLMGSEDDEDKSPFVWRFNFGSFLHVPRKGEYINFQGLPFDLKVVDVKHTFTVGSWRTPHVFFYVNFTDMQKEYSKDNSDGID